MLFSELFHRQDTFIDVIVDVEKAKQPILRAYIGDEVGNIAFRIPENSGKAL